MAVLFCVGFAAGLAFLRRRWTTYDSTARILALRPAKRGYWFAALGLVGPVAIFGGILVPNLPLPETLLSEGWGESLAALHHAIVHGSWSEWGLAFLATRFLGPIWEELVFRGLLWNLCRRWTPVVVPFVLTTALFVLVHQNPLHMITLVPGGLFLAWLRWRSDSIGPPIVAHVANNLLATLSTMHCPYWVLGCIVVCTSLLAGLLYLRPYRWRFGRLTRNDTELQLQRPIMG